MSLLAEAMEECVYVDKSTQADGYGGVEVVWTEGATFMAAIVLDTSIEARRAAKEGVSNLYTIVTSRTINLVHGDVFRRVSDGKLFRVASDGTDKKSPASGTLDMRVVTAGEISGLPG